MFGYFFHSCLMYTIQAFWFVALAAADRMAIWPLLPISLASRSTSEVPICWVLAWLLNRWLGLGPQLTSESNATIFIPAAAAGLSDGHAADGSLPAMTISLPAPWMPAWSARTSPPPHSPSPPPP